MNRSRNPNLRLEPVYRPAARLLLNPLGPADVWRTLAVCALAMAHTTSGATTDIFLRLETQFGRNSNLFRHDGGGSTGEALPVTEPVSTSTRTHALTLAAGIPLASDSTRLTLTTSLAHQSYGERSELNHQPSEHTAHLPWRFTDMVSGELALGRTRTAYQFEDTYTRLDTVSRNWAMAAINLKVSPSYEIPVQLATQDVIHQDQGTHGALDTTQRRATSGLMYRSPTGSTAMVGMASTRTQFPGRRQSEASAFSGEDDTDTFADVFWVYSSKTQLGLRIATRKRHFDNASGVATRFNLYRLSLAHALGTFTRVDAQVWHQPVVTTDTAFPTGIAKGARVGIVYTPNPIWNFNLQMQKDSQQDLEFGSQPGRVPVNPRTSTVSLRAQYALARGFSVFVDAAHERRVRRDTDVSKQTVLRVGLNYSFENLPGAEQRARPATPPVY